MEGASGKWREEESGESRRQQVAGDGPGYEKWCPWRMVGIFYEA